jgi:hypothetical protein
MKQAGSTINQKLILIFISFLVVFTACKKDKDESPTPEDTAVYFQCKIGGVVFTDDSRFADYGLGNLKVISKNDEEIIRLDTQRDTLGSFTVTRDGATKITYIDSTSVQYVGISGTINLTKVDKTNQKVSGNFTGVLQQANGTVTKNITEGKFNNILLEAR